MRLHIAAAALTMALTAFPVLAQTTTNPGTTTAQTPATTTQQADRDDFDWGWLGLIGLAGLAPLFMRKDRQGNVYANTTGTPRA